MHHRTLLLTLSTAALLALPLLAQEEDEDQEAVRPKFQPPAMRAPVPPTPLDPARRIKRSAADDAARTPAGPLRQRPRATGVTPPGVARAATPEPSGDEAGAPPRAAPKTEAEVDAEARFRKGTGFFNFDKAELLDVVQQISKLTKMNFILPERLKGQKITIICEKPVTTRDAFRAFLTALEINDLALVQSGKFYKIDKRKDTVRMPLPLLMDGEEIPDDDAMITAVIELQHVEVDSVQKIVQNLMSKEGTFETLASNLVLLADSGANIRRIQRILEKIDVEGGANQVHIVDIQYAAASEIAQKLQQLFEAPKAGAKPARTPVVTRRTDKNGAAPAEAEGEGEPVVLAKTIADDRTNKLIIVCSKNSFERIKEIIEILDVPVDEGAAQVYVYFLNNADAEEIARTIQALTQGTQSAAAKKGKGAPGQAGAAELFEGQVKVTADKSTNSLVITSIRRDYKRLTRVIEKLDVRRPQVFVEAVIMEVSLSKNLNLGLNLYSGYTAPVPGVPGEGVGLIANPGGESLITGAGTSAALQSATGGASASAVSATNLAAFLGFLAFRGPPIPGADKFGLGDFPSFGAVLQAVQKDADVDVLSTPHILTTDNEKAEILVGQNVPFAGSIAGGGGAGGYSSFYPMVSVQRQDVALKFAVTPHVSEDKQVRLEIEQEISDLGEYIDVGFGQKQPVTTKRNAKTTVVVRDQQTIILGGLISNRKSKTETKVPILGDLPIVGWAFKTYGDEGRKTNLLLVLTPYVIEGDEDFRRIYDRKLQERKEFIEFFYGGEDLFQAPIEYAKKTGAYGNLHKHVHREMLRVENGGPGLGDELLVSPPSEATIDIAPIEGAGAGEGGEGEPGAAPAPVAPVPGFEPRVSPEIPRPSPSPSPSPSPGGEP